MSDLPKYRIYPTEGGWYISTPYNRRFPSYVRRAKVYPTVWEARQRIDTHMHVSWREVGWMIRPERDPDGSN